MSTTAQDAQYVSRKPKPYEVTPEQFAAWSVEYDVATGGQDRGTTLGNLPLREREIYLNEAAAYLAKTLRTGR